MRIGRKKIASFKEKVLSQLTRDERILVHCSEKNLEERFTSLLADLQARMISKESRTSLFLTVVDMKLLLQRSLSGFHSFWALFFPSGCPNSGTNSVG